MVKLISTYLLVCESRVAVVIFKLRGSRQNKNHTEINYSPLQNIYLLADIRTAKQELECFRLRINSSYIGYVHIIM